VSGCGTELEMEHLSPLSRGPDLLALPRPGRRLRLGLVGGGRIAKVQTLGVRLSDRWDIVAGSFSSDPAGSIDVGQHWYLPQERIYSNYQEMVDREAAREDGVEAVIIATPNDSHFAIASAFVAAGIDVFCEKPLTATLNEAVALRAAARRTKLVFAVAHAYSGHAMIRQAKAMVAAGEIGRVRQIHVEYAQEWMMDEEAIDLKHVRWRQDPKRSGGTACTADIGTHAHHLAYFVTGLEMTRLRAELLVCGAPKQLDDTVYVSARYEGDVPGLLWASQVAPGHFVGLRLRVFGEKGGLSWDQENPDYLLFSPLRHPTQLIRRGFGAGNAAAAERLTRIPSGNAEGWLEAWSNLFAEFAVAVWARQTGRTLPPGLLQYPTIEDGVRGMQFVDAVVRSDAAGGGWVDCALPSA